jgi:hypothetical protein
MTTKPRIAVVIGSTPARSVRRQGRWLDAEAGTGP